MNITMVAASLLAAVSAGGIAYVFIHPILSGANRAEKRQKALVGSATDRRARINTVNRRDQVAQSLRDLEDREKARHTVTLEGRIAQAGLDWSKSKFMVVSGVLGVVLAVALLAGTGSPYTAGAALLIGGLGLPRWALSWLKSRRIDRYLDDLPNAMDVIVRGIKSGLPVGDCLRIVAAESRDPVKSEFRFLVDQQSLGVPLAEAVGKLFERVPVPETNFFAIVIGIQSKSGGNLSEALGNLARVLRERKKMKGKIQAMSMEAKASGVIIAALPFIVAGLTYMSSPDYISLLWTTSMGKLMLLGSGFWMLIGITVMRKMINFDF